MTLYGRTFMRSKIKVLCPSCGKSGMVPDQLAGARIRCPKCQTVFQISTGQGETEAETELSAASPDSGIAGPVAKTFSWFVPALIASSLCVALITMGIFTYVGVDR